MHNATRSSSTRPRLPNVKFSIPALTMLAVLSVFVPALTCSLAQPESRNQKAALSVVRRCFHAEAVRKEEAASWRMIKKGRQMPSVPPWKDGASSAQAGSRKIQKSALPYALGACILDPVHVPPVQLVLSNGLDLHSSRRLIQHFRRELIPQLFAKSQLVVLGLDL
jgi:hypothetical protein